ncbi:MAG: type II toxin-antitoxin system PemK/MazF family toxin, partial [Acidimicrobiales bacterium]
TRPPPTPVDTTMAKKFGRPAAAPLPTTVAPRDPNDKSRPVLVVTGDEAITALNNVVVAPVTSTLRAIPTCVPLGRDEGIDHDSVTGTTQR